MNDANTILNCASASNNRPPLFAKTFIILMIPGTAIPFLNFTRGLSPWNAVKEISGSFGEPTYGLMGLSFFLIFPILIWKVWMISSLLRQSSVDLVLGYALAILSSLPIIRIFISLVIEIRQHWKIDDWMVMVILGWMILCITGTAWIIRRLYRGTYNRRVIINAWILCLWVTNAILCLLLFNPWNDRSFFSNEVGVSYYLTIPISMAVLAEIIILNGTSHSTAS